MTNGIDEKEPFYRSLLRKIPVSVAITIKEGRILECNEALLEMTGYSEEEIAQIHLRDMYRDPNDREILLERIDKEGPGRINLLHFFSSSPNRRKNLRLTAASTLLRSDLLPGVRGI